MLLDRFFASRRKGHAGSRSAGRSLSNRSRPNQALPTRTGPRPSADAVGIAAERTRILTAILLRHPTLLRGVGHAYAGLLLDPRLARLRECLSEWAKHAGFLDPQALIDHLDAFGLRTDIEHVLGGAPVPLPACVSPAARLVAEAEEGWVSASSGFPRTSVACAKRSSLPGKTTARGLTRGNRAAAGGVAVRPQQGPHG